MKSKILLKIFIAILGLQLLSCELDERPFTATDKKAIFSSEEGLKAYSISFYDLLPDASTQSTIEQSLVDYGATNSLGGFILRNGYSENNSSGWSWSALRNINYFIENNNDPEIADDIKNNYTAIARFFRALFYYDKVTRFGDVPWIDHPLEPTEEEILYGERDSRELVMEKVYEDLIYAAENISRTTDAVQSTLVTKWVAYGMISRVALFEGTFRKYHNLNLSTSADVWLQRAIDAAAIVMEQSGKTLNENYRELFISEVPPVSETMLAIAFDGSLSIKYNGNWKWASETYGTGLNLIRPFINTYLQIDGTPYTNREDWEYEDFFEEFQGRDQRLSSTLRYPGYLREGKIALPVFGGLARIGYQPIKLMVDATLGDDKTESTHALQLMRYAEILLNYAEAKAELGKLTDEDWAKTVGALRKRAGITGGLNTMPTIIDNYFQNTYFPEISNPAILEIRRERAIELIFEGFRFNDLRRWKKGELLTMSWTGMYIPDVNIPLDVDHNGTHDVIYYTDDKGLESALAAANTTELYRVKVSKDPKADIIQVHPAKDDKGYYLAWYTNNDDKKVWGPKQYLYPIPIGAINLNHNLKQNPGWENGATNDGN